MEYVIDCIYPVEARFEFSVNFNGSNFLVIYGRHINGGFCCIPNWGIGCEMADPYDTFYNTEKLCYIGVDESTAKVIAHAIREVATRTEVVE